MPTFLGRLEEQTTAGMPNGRFTVIECIRPVNECPDHVDANPEQAAGLEDVLAANNGLAMITWHQEQLPTDSMIAVINVLDDFSAPMIQTEAVPQTVDVSALNLTATPARLPGEAFGDCVSRLLGQRGLLAVLNAARLSACLVRAAMLSLPEIPAGPIIGLPISVALLGGCIISGTTLALRDILVPVVNCLSSAAPVTRQGGNPAGGSDPVPVGGG